MPSQRRHVRAALHNEALANALLGAGMSPPWAVVLSFCAALHWVDALLAQSRIHPQAHDERNRYVLRVQQLSPIRLQYRTLETRSREARYDLVNFSSEEAADLISGHLADVRGHIQRLL